MSARALAVLLAGCAGADPTPGFYAQLVAVPGQLAALPADATFVRFSQAWYFEGNAKLCSVTDSETSCGDEATHVAVFNGSLYAARLGGVFRSGDGRAFTAMASSPPRVSSLIGAGDALLAFVPSGAVWRSTDGDRFEKLADLSADTDSGGVKTTSRFVRSALGTVYLVRSSSSVQGSAYDLFTAWEYVDGALKDVGGADRSFLSVDGVQNVVGGDGRFAWVSYPLDKLVGNDRWYHPFDSGLHFATTFARGDTSTFTPVFVNPISVGGQGPVRATPIGFDEAGRLWLLSGQAVLHTREALDPTHDAAARKAVLRGKGCDQLVSMLGFMTDGVDPENLTVTSAAGPIRFFSQWGTGSFESRTYVYSPSASLMVGLRPNEPYFVTDYDGVCLTAGRHTKGEMSLSVP